jgi:hypothetical protein
VEFLFAIIKQGVMIMPKKKIIFTQLVCAVIIISCLSCSVPLKSLDKASFQTISISNNVQMPEEMYYNEPTAVHEKENADKIKYLMKLFDIDVSQIVREQFTKELESSGVFNSIVPEGGDGEIILRVNQYGFGYGFEPGQKPMMAIDGSLQASDGSVFWRNYAYVTNLNTITPAYSIEKLTNNPESLREAFEITTAILVQELVSHMKGEK